MTRKARRILIVSRSTIYHRGAGGMETSMADLVATLHEIGVRTALVTTQADAGIPRGPHEQVWSIPTPRPGRYSHAWRHRVRTGTAWWAWEPDVIVGIGDSAASMISVARERQIPIVSHNHGTTLDEARSALATRTLRGLAQAFLNLARTCGRANGLRQYTQVWTVSVDLARQLSHSPYLVNQSRVHHVPNTIATTTYAFDQRLRDRTRHAIGLGPAAKVGVFSGRLDRQKGADLAVAATLQTPDHHLIVVGDGPARLKLEDAARRHPRGSAIIFMGRVPPAAVAEALSAADYFVFPTRRREGFPMTTLEAAAAGLPVVATSHARVPHGITHVEVSPSAGDLRAAIESLELPDPSRRASSLPDCYRHGSNADLLDKLLGEMI